MCQLKHSLKSKQKSDMAPANACWAAGCVLFIYLFQTHGLKS